MRETKSARLSELAKKSLRVLLKEQKRVRDQKAQRRREEYERKF